MVNAHVTKITDQEISGYFDTTGRVWGGVDVAKVYFVIKLERPLVQLNAWVGDNKVAKKIDVFWQLENNWNRFVEYLWEMR